MIKKKLDCHLEVIIVDKSDAEYDRCDGCHRKYEEGEKKIHGIDSCCGGCSRQLCSDCIKEAYEMLYKA